MTIKIVSKPADSFCDSCGEVCAEVIQFKIENKKYEGYMLPDLNLCVKCKLEIKEQL